MVVALPVGAKRLKFSDIDRAVISGDGAGAFAQDFLWTETPAYFGEIGCKAENAGRLIVLLLFNGEQSFGDVIMKRAAHNARFGGRAVNAARRFNHSLSFVIARKNHLKSLEPLRG
jgi:hypothetical protein